MSVPFYIEHGNKKLLHLPGLEISKRQRSLDSMRRTIRTDSEDTFREGGTLPGFPHMRLKEVVSREDGPGWLHELSAEGLRRGMDKLEDNRILQPAEGWDEGPQTWLTIRPEAWQAGRVHPVYPSLWMTEGGTKEDLNGHVWRVSAPFKGIIPQENGLPKARKRRITVGNQVVNSSTTLALTNGLKDGKPWPFVATVNGVTAGTGWSDQRFTNLDSSRVQVADTFITFEAPPTDQLPGHLTPENAPPVKDIFDLPWYSSAGFSFNWPWAWSLKSISSEPLMFGLEGTPYLTTIVTEYVPRAQPK